MKEMTNQEAEIIIGNLPIFGDDCYSITEYQEAKAMAIDALEQMHQTQWHIIKDNPNDVPEDNRYIIVCYWLNLSQTYDYQVMNSRTDWHPIKGDVAWAYFNNVYHGTEEK